MADSATTGPVAASALGHTTARLAAVIHASTLVVALAVGALVGPPSGAWFAASMAVLAGWTVAFCVLALRRGLSFPLVAADVLVTTVICLSLGRLVPVEIVGNGASWVAPLTACTLLTVAFTLSAALTVGLGLVVTASYVLGAWLAHAPSVGAGQAITGLYQIVLMTAVMVFLRRAGNTADAVFADEQRDDRVVRIDRARRADERAQLRAIHGTALATLTMIGSGSVTSAPATVRRWAEADLRVLRSMRDDDAGGDIGERLDQRLLEAADRHRDQLRVVFDPAPCRVPVEVVDAMSQAVGEAVANAARHAGTDEVALLLQQTGGTVTVQVDDRGRGFDPGLIPPHRYGVRESIIGSLEGVGGSARVDSAPGAGCLWTLVWPAAAGTRPAARPVAPHFERGAMYAALVVAGWWHLVNDTLGVLGHWSAYRPPHGGLIAAVTWAAYTIIGAVAAARLFRGRPGGRWFPPVAGAALLAGVVINVVICTGPGIDAQQMVFSNANWAVGASGWTGIVVFWRARLGYVLGLFAGNVLGELATLEIVAPLDRRGFALWTAAAYGITMLQVVFVFGARFLQRYGDSVARSVQRQNRALAAWHAANAVHDDRRHRYAQIGAAAADLLAELATGQADHTDAAIRHRASVEAARLRRLLAERDDVTDRLLHELRACADVAARRGVAVDLVTVGTLPTLTVDARRALTEPPARLLATARSWARVTVAASDDEVSVGVVVDGVLAEQELAGLAEVEVGQEGEGLWLETMWRR